MTDASDVTINDFVDFFDDLALPVYYTDTILKRKLPASHLIGDANFKKYIGDSIFSAYYKKEKPKVYALGKFRNNDAETYLLIKTTGSKNCIYVLALNPDNNFMAYMPLMSDNKKSNTINKVSIDKRFTFTLTDNYINPDGSSSENYTVYAYNNVGLFMAILKDGLREGEELPIINPIDTLSANGKYAGNYGSDKRNFISIRDAANPGQFLFFINFEKANNCAGELKGIAKLIGRDSAVYLENGDPCTIGFKFKSGRVRINEIRNCGNKRPQDCSFNASYIKIKGTASRKKVKK